MNFEEVRQNPVYFGGERFVMENGVNHLTSYGREEVRLPPEDYDQKFTYSTRRAVVVDGQARQIPGNVTMNSATTNQYMDIDKTHVSHSNLKATINAEIHDMKRKTEGQVMMVQTEDHQSFCPETIVARLNFDTVHFHLYDVQKDVPLCKDPLEYGQVCLTEKRIFFVSRRRADYTVHIYPQSKKAFDQTQTVTTQPQATTSTEFPKNRKPSSYRLQMDQNIGSSYYEMIPVWNVKSVSMNTSGKSTSSVLIYSKSSCCGRCCGCCSCLRDLLEVIFCDKCMFAPGKTWHSAQRGQDNLVLKNYDCEIDNLESYAVQIHRKVVIHAMLPAWDQKAVIEIAVDAPTSIDKIADFIRLLQHHSRLLNAPVSSQRNIVTISNGFDNGNGFVLQDR